MISSALDLGGTALRWSLRFYAKHFWLVFGLSLVPTAQRFFVIRFGEDLPTAASWASEALTLAARVLLGYLVLRIMVAEFGPLTLRDRWGLLTAGIDARLRDFLLQFVLLGLAFILLSVVPELLISNLTPQTQQNLVQALVVSVKNPTVIAVTMLWMVGIGRALMRSAADNQPSLAAR